MHPTPKTYRSQSYSVGQLEPDAAAAGALGSSAILGGRGRPMASGLQHRPSRPSMLSEMSSDGGMLGKVKEVEDDDDTSTNESLQGSQQQQQSADARTIEYLARENAYLRQHANPQFHAARIRPRASTAAAYGIGNGYGLHESVPEESDYAVDELDESNDAGELATKRAMSRRMTEYGGAGLFRVPFTAENRKIENVKKAYWQSAPYGAGGDMSQSRRHSFADVPIPTRQASIGSIGEAVMAHEQGSQDSQQSQDFASPYSDAHNFPANAPQSYFGGPPHMPGGQAGGLLGSAYANPYPSPYAMHSAFANRPTSPHRGMYGMTQPNRSTPLHIVLFKCARADVFYIQEGTGLTVKPGDLVIVEADRGTDLGTVAVDNVDWAEAKRLKEHYAEEQYKWLMMYSQNAGVAQEGVGAGLMAASNGLQGSAVGGMGPPGQHHGQEPNAGELKPKLIKRLAQSHEIHALRDKEGNEAKAKRVCMQKVKEHGLNMEILDAEFQMSVSSLFFSSSSIPSPSFFRWRELARADVTGHRDWKKLTFYYFADSYINFNSLVTDLFKIYKTRIWMSAINPASFASQPLGLQAPSGIGPGAVGVGRGAATTERRPNQQPEQPAASFSAGRPTSRGFQAPGLSQQAFGAERAGAPAGYPPSFGYGGPYGAFGNVNVPRAAGVSFGPGGMPSADAYPPAGFPQPGEYPGGLSRLPPGQAGSRPHDQGMSPLSAPGDWVNTFQSLSLNSPERQWLFPSEHVFFHGVLVSLLFSALSLHPPNLPNPFFDDPA